MLRVLRFVYKTINTNYIFLLKSTKYIYKNLNGALVSYEFF
jgi:hypothetical protein